MVKSVNEIISRMMTATGTKNQKQLSGALGVSPARITDAKNRGVIPGDWLLKLAETGINLNWIKTGTDQMLIDPRRAIEADDVKSVPLLSFVQAGEWTEAVESFPPGYADKWVETTAKIGPRAFALRVVGNSMEPRFREGDTIIVDPEQEAESGAFVVAKINHDEATFKQLLKDGGKVFLRPLNDAFPVMDVTGREVRIVGRVVARAEDKF